jgi:hypothetical protein
MEDVEITARPDLAIVTVQGPRSLEVAGTVGERIFAADRLGYGGVDLLVPIEGVEGTLQRLRDAGATDVSEATWEVARVLANRPRFAVDFDGSSYPQEARLEERAVSFQKGCYVGQEVVHMLQVRGQASRRLVPLHLDALVEPGRELTSPEGKPVGRVTSVIEAPDHSVRALGYVKRAHAEAETVLRAGSATARVLD